MQRKEEREDRKDMIGAKPALTAATLGFFTITLDALIVSVALPAIDASLGAGMSGLQWVVDGYTLPFAALLLFAGGLTDRYGSKRIFSAGVSIFTLSSLLCSVAPEISLLVSARFFQGIGAALMTPASLSLIGEAYTDPSEKSRAVGFWAAGGAVASTISPLIGGLLSAVSWRLIFLVNFPVGIAILLILRRVGTSYRRSTPFDFLGQITSFISLVAFLYGLIQMGNRTFSDAHVLVPLVTALITGMFFLLVQMKKRNPMVPRNLFISRTITATVLIGFTFMIGFFGMVFVLSLYLQVFRGLSVLETGLAFIPVTGFSIIMPILAASLAEKRGPWLPIALGQIAMFSGLLLLSAFSRYASVPVLILCMIPVGLGAGMAMPSATSLLLNSVPSEISGTAGGLLNTSRQIGGALGVALFGTIISVNGYETGLTISLAIAGLLLLFTTVFGVSTMKPASSTTV